MTKDRFELIDPQWDRTPPFGMSGFELDKWLFKNKKMGYQNCPICQLPSVKIIGLVHEWTKDECYRTFEVECPNQHRWEVTNYSKAPADEMKIVGLSEWELSHGLKLRINKVA